MEKFEKVFFNSITKELKFFMRDYYSNYHNKNKWIGLLDLDEVMVGVIVVKDSDEEVDFNEAREYLAKSLNKPFILNLIILTSGEYINYGESNYNKLIFSLKERKIIYCSNGSKAFIPIIDYIVNIDSKRKISFKEYKVTYTIIILNILLYLIEVIKSRNLIDIDIYTLIQMGAKVNVLINSGEIYRLLTSAFLHGGIIHIFFNMSALNIIGREVEAVYGSKRYIAIYVISALGGSVVSYLFKPNSISVGASGAIFGLLGAMLIFGLKERDKIGKQYMKNILETIGLNVIIGITIPNIDNFAHLGGLILGAITSFILFKKKNFKTN
ncbi:MULTISPECIES: rhomboid family intramembrane serine protease [Clostridium]|uniref:rhomboid family intramembrane serine protease n=1 Tax=Clostridium TaxID=1485 RepID=UPI0018A94F56|nr:MULTISPECIES: rhomboid family intramembrane serine protease [Clostridium]MDB1932209.1 rhomboid family intramembrane serine protease [Clostridium tertium]MDB1936361.1 rhomboid family intramembrane serine protease [Clostridium tertium]MDB1968504.1 rhomboid family intramembrane serine protease [Clostridium tertium]MDU1279658.1 rhomboid family intramembrane serine protease [Clostridium sp.]MDU1568133.1 rhomboid family intramembrane serine protease [Clostridium sp.]